MWWKYRKLFILLSSLVMFILSGCSPKNLDQVTLNVSAASSLKEPLNEIINMYNAQHPNAEITLNFAGTNTLKMQILEGAEVDLFLSANKDIYEELEGKGYFLKGQILAHNDVVLIASLESQNTINQIEDLAKEGCQLILAEEGVPISIYAKQIMEALELSYGEGFKEQCLQNVVSKETNVKQVLTKIVLGEGDCGFVYNSDLMGETRDKVRVLPLPEEAKVETQYWIGQLRQTKHQEEAEQLYDFILSEQGRQVMQKYGFR